MEIIIQSLGFKASASLESFITEKLKTLKNDSIISADVTLYKGPSANTDSDYCEISLQVPGNKHFVKKHSQYFETSFTECMEILAQMVKKLKEKTEQRRVDKASIVSNQGTGIEDSFEGDLEDLTS